MTKTNIFGEWGDRPNLATFKDEGAFENGEPFGIFRTPDGDKKWVSFQEAQRISSLRGWKLETS